jgi:hypothetical protein
MKLIFALLLLPAFAFAAEEGNQEQEVKEALEQTKALLNDTAFRNGYQSDPNAKEAHAKVKEIVGNNSRQQQEIYSLSSEAFEKIVADAKGDPGKIMEILQKAQADPKEFMRSLPPEQQKRIRELASEIDKKKEKP